MIELDPDLSMETEPSTQNVGTRSMSDPNEATQNVTMESSGV